MGINNVTLEKSLREDDHMTPKKNNHLPRLPVSHRVADISTAKFVPVKLSHGGLVFGVRPPALWRHFFRCLWKMPLRRSVIM